MAGTDAARVNTAIPPGTVAGSGRSVAHLTPARSAPMLGYNKKPEAGSRKPEAGSRKPEAGSRKPEAGSRKPEAGTTSAASGLLFPV